MAAQQQGSRRGSLRPSNAAQSRSSIGGRRSSFGAAAAPAVPRACTPVNTVISQSSTFAPRSAVDWSRAWITEPRVMMRAPKPVYNTGPRPQTAPLPRKTIPRAQPPRVRLIRYSMKSTRPAVALPMSKLKRSMIKVKAQVKLEQHTVILLHGVGDQGNSIAGLAAAWAPHFPHIKFVLPTAPAIPVTMANEQVMTAW